MDSRTWNDVYKEEYQWMLRNVAPARLGIKAEHIGFLQNVCRFYTGQKSPDLQALEIMGEKLVNSNADEPLVFIWYGNILFKNEKYEEAEKFLSIGMEMTHEKQRPIISIFFAMQNLARIQYKKTRNECQTDGLENAALDALDISLKNNDFKKTEMPIVISLLEQIDGAPFRNIWREFYNRINSNKNIDPWLKYVVEGNAEISEAWKARGYGWASEVTEEGWKGFRMHMLNAGNALTEAWKLHPEFPQAPASMIGVAQGGYKNSSYELWFSRTVAAQMDYDGAYLAFLEASLPRWGGSYSKMMEFGEKCLATKRFDTNVPMYYLVTARNAARDLKNNRWRAIFHEKDVGDNLDLLFEGLLNEKSRTKDRDRILTQNALTQMWRGNYKKAKAIFDQVNSEVDLHDGFCGKALSWSGRNRTTIEAELRAFTGPYGEILKKAEKLSINNSPKSIPLFIEAMNKYRNDNEIYTYLRRRIALQMSGCRARGAHLDLSAMHIATEEGSIETIQFLLDSGADINAKDRHGDTPLHQAAVEGNVEICKILLKNQANINAINKQNRTPLYQACIYKHKETAHLLIESGADVNIPCNMRSLPLHIALLYNMPEIASLLIKSNSKLEEMTLDKWAPLHIAIYYKEPTIAIDLINNGVDVNVRNGRNYTPLMLAVYAGYPDIVQKLVEKMADLEAKSPHGETALHLAAEWDRPEIIKILLDNNANVKARNSSGLTPLERAKLLKHKKCIDILENKSI